MIKRDWRLVLAFVVTLCVTKAGREAIAAPPPEINIQGMLESDDGNPVTGSHEFRVAFFDVMEAGVSHFSGHFCQ